MSVCGYLNRNGSTCKMTVDMDNKYCRIHLSRNIRDLELINSGKAHVLITKKQLMFVTFKNWMNALIVVVLLPVHIIYIIVCICKGWNLYRGKMEVRG